MRQATYLSLPQGGSKNTIDFFHYNLVPVNSPAVGILDASLYNTTQ